jgi:hypothetical protein
MPVPTGIILASLVKLIKESQNAHGLDFETEHIVDLDGYYIQEVEKILNRILLEIIGGF